jgi:hypothetical protein
MDLISLLAIAATITILLVYITYFHQMTKGQSTPNPATWTIWLAMMLLNAITYALIVQDFSKALFPTVTSILVGLMFTYSIIKGKFGPFKKLEVVILILALLIGIGWQITGNAILANLLLQVILFISFIPTAVGLLKRTLKEKPLPWILSIIAYQFQLATVLINFDGNYAALAYPIVNGVLGNGSVTAIIIIMNKKKNLHKPTLHPS